jgi:hypothetical protein
MKYLSFYIHFKSYKFLLLTLSILMLSWACGADDLPVIDESIPLTPFDKPTISDTPNGTGPGHWDKSMRAVSIDEQDIIILTPAMDKIENNFSQLVINIPLIDKRTGEDCLTGMRATEALPEKTVARILDRISDKGLSFDQVIVQVDLMTPDRSSLYHQCLEESGSSGASFYIDELRRETLVAFTGLARLSEIDKIVVGLELNAYENFDREGNINHLWDYVNLVDMYHDIYTEIKDLNDDLKVGPSVSWSKLKLNTLPAIAEEFALELDDLLTLEFGLRRSVWPLLTNNGEKRADFVGVSFIPDTASPPYLGTPTPEDTDAVQQFYRNLSLLTSPPQLEMPLPIAYTMIDWPTQNIGSGGQKTDYLIALKQALSNLPPDWVAWRRLSDIPEEPPETSPCRSVTSLGHAKDFCYAGLLDYNGVPRSVWEEFTTNP